MRQALNSIFSSDRDIEVIGTAADPFFAAQKIQKEIPDVITLDIEMPRMDGLTFLRKIMQQHPIPVVIISSLSIAGTETALKALEFGAVEIITKPQLTNRKFFEESRIRLCDVVKAAANANLNKLKGNVKAVSSIKVEPRYTADAVIAASATSMIKTTELVVAIGASTGGTEALKELLEVLPPDSPGIVIVQHMPELFTRSFAQRLNEICKISVKEAENGDSVVRGRALIAPGNKHTLLKRSGAKYYV